MACHGRLHDTAVPAPWKLSYAPCQQGFFFPFLSLPSPLHSPSFFLFPCPLLHSPFCWEVRIQGGGGSPAGAAATAAVEPQLLRRSKWSWWVKKSHQNGGFCSSGSPQWQRQPSLLTQAQAPTLSSRRRRAIPGSAPGGSGTGTPGSTLLLRGDAFPQGTAPPRAAAAPRAKSDSNPGCPPGPESSLCREQKSKELIKAWEINHVTVQSDRAGTYEGKREMRKQKWKNHLQT